MYEQLGHDGPATFPWTDSYITGKPIERCPLRQLQLADDVLREEILRWKHVHFPLFTKGRLLVAGEIDDQPARWLEAMLYLEQLEARKDHKHLQVKLEEQKEAAK